MESIEKDYVLVNSRFVSLEDFSEYFEESVQVQDNPLNRISICSLKRSDLETKVAKQTKDLSSSSTDALDKFKSNELEALEASSKFSALSKEQGISSLHPSNRLELLHQYVHVLGELSQEKVSLHVKNLWQDIRFSLCVSFTFR